MMIHSYCDSPVGPLLLTGDGDSLTGLYTAEHVRLPTPPGTRDDQAFAEVHRQLAEYFAGDRLAFELPLAPVGTEFQRRVWHRLAQIPLGQTRSYRELAVEVGNPLAVRAVGAANGRNPISIVVPCHRVIGSAGSLTGYAGGLATKRWLLDHESRIVARQPVSSAG